MPYYFFVWPPEIIEHLAENDVTQEEFEEVVSHPELEDISRSSGDPVVFGLTSNGKYMCCVFRRIDDDTIEPITAYEVDE